MITDRLQAGVVCLDLRHRGDPADAPDALHGEVDDALARTRQSDVRRFLVLDDAAELVAHQLLYERLYAYGPAQVLCLAQGGGGDRALRRPHALSPPSAGVLWIPDVFAGAGGRDGGPVPLPEEADEALRPLVELLADASLFDTVLGELGEVLHSVAVPAAQVLEHDLTEEARTRAWRRTLENLAGQDIPAPVLVTEGSPGAAAATRSGTRPGTASNGPGSGGSDSVPAGLARFLGDMPAGTLADGSCLVPGGPAEEARRACDRALRDAEDGYELVRRPASLFTPPVRAVDLPERLEALSDALGTYRDTVAGALTDGGGDRLRPDQRARLLKRGIQLPELPEAPRADVGPGLRTYTERLLAYGLPLRSVAARLAALSDLSAPAGSAARLARLDEICPGRRVAELAVPPPFTLRGSRFAHAAPVFLLAFAAGLWPLLGWALGPSAGFAAAALTLLMVRRRPSRSYDGRLDGGGSTRSGSRLVAGLVGGGAGALTGQLLDLPRWAGAAGLVVALLALGLLVARDWTAAVDAWWRDTETEFAADALDAVDALLTETVVQDWLFAEARYHCSDGARAVSLMVRSLAETVEDRLMTAASPAARDRAGHAGGSPAYPMAHGATADGARARTGHDRTGQDRTGRDRSGQQPGDAWNWDSWGDSSADDGWSGSLTGTQPAAPPEHELPEDPWQPAAPADPPWLEREWGDGGPALVDTLLDDLAHGVRGILAGRWAAVERDPAEAGRISLRDPLLDVLDEEHTVLRRDGATSAPHFARDPELRPGAAELLGVAADHAARLVATADGTDDAVPLCAAADRRMLSKDPAGVRQVRFAPEAMRRGTEADPVQDGGAGAGEDVVWTPGGRHAGVLRLVPLRGEIVRTVRAEQGDAP
ncbi:hypothetical protein [Streptomyces sp. NPDC127033]|uniref:hypothetical protein n=1 Tax=Streptomyces sp. NPDC127033 TaxID=3347110 RepID=UPI00364C5C59